jgi:hypothetical protein
VTFSQRKNFLVCALLSIPFSISCKARKMNEGSSRSFSTAEALEICGKIIFEKINSDKSSSIYVRTDWKTATRISDAFRTGRDSTLRLVEVNFPPLLPAPSRREVRDAPQKIACIQGEFIQKRIVARSFTIRDPVLEEQEVTACGEIFEEEGLFGVHVANGREGSPVLVVGRNTKATRRLLASLIGERACLNGRPFLAQEHLALLTDSASIVRATRGAIQPRMDSPYSLTSDLTKDGRDRGKRFIDGISGKTEDEQVKLLTENILELENLSEQYKWGAIESELSDNPQKDFLMKYNSNQKDYVDAYMVECCDKLNELINEKKEGGFFQKIFRKGANPSTMYMDGKNDFSEVRKSELYDGDIDLELDLL